MNCHRTMCAGVCAFIASVLVVCGAAAGFNPQPEPPGMPGNWYVEGYADMWAEDFDQTSAAMPFGIDPLIVSDGMVDFSAGVMAWFNAPSTADDKPVDGLYDAEFEYLLVQIGDTSWDEMMPGTIQFQVVEGVVTGCTGTITDTMPTHPDLSFALPASPATWEALDKRGDVDLGVVMGTYSLRDGIVPEPATACLLAIGALALTRRRRK